MASANGLLAPLNWAYDETVPRWPYDPVRAKRLLDEAGFSDPDGNGPLPRFRLSFKTTNIDLRRRIAEALKEQLQEVGIELEIRSYEWGTFFSDIKKGNFHLYSLAWVGIMDPDIFYQIFHSQSVPPAGDNRGRYHNAELDRLLEQGRATTDAAGAQADLPARPRNYRGGFALHPALVVEKRRRQAAGAARFRALSRRRSHFSEKRVLQLAAFQ